ncbi:MAG: YebC/PmpR family DNA-binding transcriptional regulator [Gammaproteobacteria bacterium]|nr:YebC/PmpR family DNA-binding transcriptional regulator [Gammaproteobacteria bacterium]
MAGHSKWANIRFRKAAQDARRGKVFTKLIAEITVAARLGGGDADANPRLRSAVDKALTANMPRDTITRAIKRGTGEAGGAAIEEIRYEGYGPNGMAVLVECTTDNRNRAVSEVRHAFSKHGGNLGTDGSVAYLFEAVGSIVFAESQGADEERIMEIALEAGADDIDSADGIIEVVTSKQDYLRVERAFVEAGLTPQMSELIQRPASHIEVRGEAAEQSAKLIDTLEQLDDVQNVFTNAVFVEGD